MEWCGLCCSGVWGDLVGEVWVILVYVWLGPRGLFAGADIAVSETDLPSPPPAESPRTQPGLLFPSGPAKARRCQGRLEKTYKIIVSVSFFFFKEK